MTSSIALKFVLFADDTNIFYSSKSMDNLFAVMNLQLERVSLWFKAIKLSLNIKKSSYMCFGIYVDRTRYIDQLMIDGSPLPYSSTSRFFVVTIHDQLNWNSHINKLVQKLNRNAGVIYKIRYNIDPSVTLKLYDSMILCHSLYCSIIWGLQIAMSPS